MTQELINTFIQSTQQGVVEAVQKLIEEQNIEEDIAKEAQMYAQQIVNHQKDPSQPLPQEHKGIDLTKNPIDRFVYFLVLEYLDSIGLKFAPSVLRYESRHQSLVVPRQEVAKQFCLRSYDRTPLLVQMIEETRLYHQNHPDDNEVLGEFGEEEEEEDGFEEEQYPEEEM